MKIIILKDIIKFFIIILIPILFFLNKIQASESKSDQLNHLMSSNSCEFCDLSFFSLVGIDLNKKNL
jgi:hypothetical protein